MKHALTGKTGSTSGTTTAANVGVHAKPTATASALAGKDAEITKLKDDIATLKRLNEAATYTAKKATPAKSKARHEKCPRHRTLTPVLTRRQLLRSEPRAALRG